MIRVNVHFLEMAAAVDDSNEAKADRLVGGDNYIEYWSNKWADLLQVNRKYLGAEGSSLFRKWIREQVAANTPYDKFAHSVLATSGSNR